MAYNSNNQNTETLIGFVTFDGDRFVPDKGLTIDNTPRLVTAKFGDGYEQRARKGINSLDSTFNVTFSNRSTEDAYKLCDFFDAVLGVTAFFFTLPQTKSGTKYQGQVESSTSKSFVTYPVVCDTYNKTLTYNNYYTVTATFRRVYN